MFDEIQIMPKEQNKTSEKGNKIAFVIAPIGEKKTDVRKRSDQILKYIIEPIVAEQGFNAIRADKISEPGIVTTQIIDHILNDPLVIADLTGHNPNVMYELALRHFLKKPVVQIIEENQPLPFDVSGNRTIKLNHNDMDSVNDAKEELRKQVKEVIANPGLVDSPISQAISLSSLRQTGNPVNKMLSNMSATIAYMSGTLNKIEQKLFEQKPAYTSGYPITTSTYPPHIEKALKKILEDYYRNTAIAHARQARAFEASKKKKK